jgi:hypothetical protein
MNLPTLLDTPQLLALAAALGWASGFRLYAVVFLTGLAGFMGWMELPPGLQVLQHPGVLGASGLMLLVEFFADKVPFLDTAWDAIHTLIRIPAGAALAAGALGADDAAMGWIAAIVGGGLAATSHATKMTTRAAVNTSPEPFSNVAISFAEDGLVVFLLWLSATHPQVFTLVLLASIVVAIILLVVFVKFLQAVAREVRGFLAGRGFPRPDRIPIEGPDGR